MELRSHSWGVVEMAFDHENGGIIVEVIAAKICCGVIDIDHEVLGGQRRTTSHYGGKALQPEFFAKPVPCLRDAIGIKNRHVAGHKVGGGQFTNFFWR